tara:strand:+ start:1102 stop:1464 length:363 start_codon:yes stop_codon:yes gene_type:complete
MKLILKVVEYLEDAQQIIVKFCRKNAPQPIDDYSVYAIELDRLETSYDSQSLVESIMKVGYSIIKNQEKDETVLTENADVAIIEGTNLRDYVGKVFECDSNMMQDRVTRRMKKIIIDDDI